MTTRLLSEIFSTAIYIEPIALIRGQLLINNKKVPDFKKNVQTKSVEGNYTKHHNQHI